MSLNLKHVNTDILIGKGTGKRIRKHISDAKKEIKIVSPFLSAGLVNLLIDAFSRGLKVTLITSDELEDYKDPLKTSIINKLLEQKQHVNSVAKYWRRVILLLFVTLLILSLASFCLLLFLHFKGELSNTNFFYYALGSFIVSLLCKSYSSSIRVYTYTYQSLFPIKVFLSPFNKEFKNDSKSFVHSKIYVIDNRYAFLGSLNFTYAGFYQNIESMIAVKDDTAIKKLSIFIDELLETSENDLLNLNYLGSAYYDEPIN